MQHDARAAHADEFVRRLNQLPARRMARTGDAPLLEFLPGAHVEQVQGAVGIALPGLDLRREANFTSKRRATRSAAVRACSWPAALGAGATAVEPRSHW